MSAIAVNPMATPTSARRKSSFWTTLCNGEPGNPSSVEKTPAEIMNIPSAQASMRYSGQCCAQRGACSQSSWRRRHHPPVSNPGYNVMPPSTNRLIPCT